MRRRLAAASPRTLGSGDDTVSIDGYLSTPNTLGGSRISGRLAINMGAGMDSVAVGGNAGTIVGGPIVIGTGDGNDTVSLDGVYFASATSIDLGTGVAMENRSAAEIGLLDGILCDTRSTESVPSPHRTANVPEVLVVALAGRCHSRPRVVVAPTEVDARCGSKVHAIEADRVIPVTCADDDGAADNRASVAAHGHTVHAGAHVDGEPAADS